MSIVTGVPDARLRPFVSRYRLRHEEKATVQRLVFAARNAQFLEFYLLEQPRVIVLPGANAEIVPDSVVVGNQALGRVELFLSGSLRTFTVTFRPTGFHQLFGTRMDMLLGRGESAGSVLGGRIDSLRQRLGNAQSFEEMCALADQALLSIESLRRVNTETAAAAIENCLCRAARQDRVPTVDQLVEASGFSTRHFERTFKMAVGVSPKRYLRVARLQRAIELKSLNPALTWGMVAAETGFHDQMHLVHDFKALGGDTPSRLFETLIDQDPV